jgi:LemA protein
MIFKMDVKPNFTVENEAAVSAPPKVDFSKPGAPQPRPRAPARPPAPAQRRRSEARRRRADQR